MDRGSNVLARGLLVGAASLAAAGRIRAAPAASPARPSSESKIDAALLAASSGGPQDALVLLSEQADLSGAAALRTKAEKTRFVFERLTETARRAQAGIRAELEARGIAYEAFWIANAVRVRADRELLRDLASRDDVRRIDADAPFAVRLPTPRGGSSRRLPSTVGWNLEILGIPQVWANGVTGSGVVIGDADTGVAWQHPALKAKYRGWNGTSATHSYNWHDAIHDASAGNPCGSDSPAPCDDGNHGTETTGILVGDGGSGNQIGVAPGARWIACRNMDQGTGTPARYTECFQWFVAPTDSNDANPDPSRAADVISNSWSCPASEGCTTIDVLRTVVENVRAAGIVVVAASGNEGPACGSIDIPALYDAAIGVGASDQSDAVTGFSTRGPGETPGRPKPDLIAPGVSVPTSDPGGGYTTFDGTSASTPHVAGVAALVLSALPALAGDVDSVQLILQGTAFPVVTDDTCGGFAAGTSPNDGAGWGRVDAAGAVQAATCPPPMPAIRVPATVPPSTAGLAASVAGEPAHVYGWTVSGGTLGTGQGTAAITFTSGDPGSTMQITVTDSIAGCSAPNGSATVQVDFLDVTPAYLFHDAVDSIALAGISGGCGAGNYCPDDAVTRDQMAVFLLRGEHGGAYNPPPATGTVFADVPATAYLADWIERLATEKITSGCGGGLYCPGDPVNRAALAKFLLLAKHGAAYRPPPATGTVFADVPLGAFLGAWIEELSREGITGGCGGGSYCPDDAVKRGEMAAFLTRAFGLP